MNTPTNTRELLDLEARFWDAMQTKNAEAAAKMTDDGCIVVGAQGVSSVDPRSMARMTAEGKWELTNYAFDLSKAQVRFLSKDVAIVAYPVSEHVVVDGKTLSLEAHDASVWVNRDGQWTCALHTESLAGDPFGRDKVH